MIEKELLQAKDMTVKARLVFETFNDPKEKRPLVLDNPKWLVRIGIVVHDDVMSEIIRPLIAKHLDNAGVEILEALKKQEALIENKIQTTLAAQVTPEPTSTEAAVNENRIEPIRSKVPLQTGTDTGIKAVSSV